MTASIIRKRRTILFVVLIALSITAVALYVMFAKAQVPGGTSRDLRHEQVGEWSCGGVTTSPHGTERPFYGVLRNEWTLDRQWLKIQFEEQQPVTDPPLREDQYWAYSEAGDEHSRIMIVNDGSYGVLEANGAQPHLLSWQGSYTVAGVAYDAKEVSERLAANRYRWSGSVEQDGTTIARYEFVCTRK